MTAEKIVDILLAEDNPADVRLTLEALKESRVRNKLHIVPDGVEALNFLRKEGRYASAPTPDVVLLDLNMPRKDGREVLDDMKADEELKIIPVVILTTSEEREDVIRTYAKHANCYVRKPVDISGFFDVIRAIEQFWFQVVTLPPITKSHA